MAPGPPIRAGRWFLRHDRGMGTDLDRLLDFAERSRLPEGGFGYLGADGEVVRGRPVETWVRLMRRR